MSDLERLPELPRISDYLFLHAERTPEREFAVLGDSVITYADAAERVRLLSRALVASGVKPGDRVATLCTPRPEFALMLFATVDIGAIWVGLNPKYQINELLHVVSDSRPSLIAGLVEYGGRDYREDLATLAEQPSVKRLVTIEGEMVGAETLAHLCREGGQDQDIQRLGAREEAGGLHPAIIVYTSGTTGTPKGALITHRGLVWCFVRQWHRWDIDPLRMICNLPINHIGCAGDVIGTCVVGGGTLVCMERFDPKETLRTITEKRVNVLFQVPTMLQLIAAQPEFEATDLSSVEIITWGGAAMPKAVLAAYQAKSDAKLEVMYGQTEATGTVTCTPFGSTDEQLTETIGQPDPEIDVRLMGDDGAVCEPGTPGEIQIKHETVFAGYWERPEATADAFTEDGFLRTGDLAVERDDAYLTIVGRLKEMFKSGGYNVYPREIELCLERNEKVSIAAVISVPDGVYDEVGHAFVVLRNGYAADADEIRDWCRDSLANYKVPKSIEIVESLPMLPIGKVDKQLLRSSKLDGDEADATKSTGKEQEHE